MPNAAALRRMRLFAIAALTVVSAPAFATAQRTFVASNGKDTDPCSITAPCRSFATAIAQTSVGGEVIVPDSAGYGPVTITQSVSIIAPAGVYGGITVFSGNGITVDGSNIKVVLRELTINGQGVTNGIEFLQGAKLAIEDCEIANGFDGINVFAPNSTVTVKNTVIRDNAEFGISASGASRVTVVNSVLANNVSAGVIASASAGTTDVMVTRSTITGSAHGLRVDSVPASAVRMVSDGNVINNAAGAAFYLAGSGTEAIYTSGNNTVGFNNGIVSGGSLTVIGVH